MERLLEGLEALRGVQRTPTPPVQTPQGPVQDAVVVRATSVPANSGTYRTPPAARPCVWCERPGCITPGDRALVHFPLYALDENNEICTIGIDKQKVFANPKGTRPCPGSFKVKK